MMKIRSTILLLGLVALCAVTIASPLGKAADSSSEESGEAGEFVKELQELCRNNSGSDAAFLELMESFQSATNCSVAAIDLQGFMLEAKTLSNETRMTFFPRYCPQLRTAYKCSDKLANDLRPCMEEDDFTIMKNFAFTLLHAVEQVCNNDGEILFEFDEPKYTECFSKVSNSFDECLTFLNGSMTRDQCSQLPGFRQCLQDKVKLPDLISVYDLFQNTLFRLTPCRNYMEIEKLKVGLVAMVHCIENTSEK